MAEQPTQPAPIAAGEAEEDLLEDEEEFEELEPDLKGLVEYVARALVDKPTAVKEARTVSYSIAAAPK